MSGKALFKEILQVGLVVKDVDAAIRKYQDVCRIGPWEILLMDKSNMHDTRLRGEKVEFSMKVAFTNVGSVQLELIEPLNDENIYAEFLRENGEGMHHIAFAVDDFDETKAVLKANGVGVLQDGITCEGMEFAYLDTVDAMSCIAELYKIPKSSG